MTCVPSNPARRRSRWSSVRISSPAPTSSTTPIATSTTTIARRGHVRAAPAIDPLPDATSVSRRLTRADCTAGRRPKATLVASAVAAVGLYGLVASSVAERRRELAIRMALGATERQAVIAAAAPGLVLAVFGVSIGLVGARAAAAVLQHLVWGVSVRDPLTFAAAASAALLVATIGTLIPALRIVRLNPVRALKQP
ncbi:MAG: hypothetical protein DMF99_28740 [Acidobacteria bacterium]|nr:MAG: hypothetical protein DMF99_28740 [Acidobacteriota bacterium]